MTEDCYGDGNVYRGVRSKDSETKTIHVPADARWPFPTQPLPTYHEPKEPRYPSDADEAPI